jgi:hypothetical protein
MRQKKDFFVDSLHVFILFNFAVAQPLFDLLSGNPGFFVARHSEPVDIVLLILVLCVLLPALVVLIEAVAGLIGRRVRKGVHGLVVTGLVAIIFLPVLNKIDGIFYMVSLVGAISLGVVFNIAYFIFKPLRTFLTFLLPALLIFPGLFLFNSPVFKIVFPEKDPSAVSLKLKDPPPIIMVVFDEFTVTSLMDEHRQIDPIRYPNFAALARDSYWFRNATTVADNTHIAIPAMLTGKYPKKFCMPTAACHPNNIFVLLGNSYELKVLEPMTQLCPKKLSETRAENILKRMDSLFMDLFIVYSHIILPPGLRGALPDIANTWMDFGAVATDQTEDKDNRKKKEILQKGALEELKKDRVCQFNQFIDSIRPAKEPTLYFQHILLPHSPYDYLPSGKKYAMDSGLRGLNSGRWGDDVTAVNQSYQRYLLQVGFVDTLIGKLITHLKTVGLYDPSLIVITADHGVSLRPNDFRRALKKTNYGDIMQIPFFIKLPNQNGGVTSDRNVETIDLLPTIADILGIRLPWPHDGRSALDLSMPERTEKIMHNDAYERFVFDSTLDAKYITLKRKLSLFGSGSKPYGLFKMGHHSEFIGRRVAEIGVAGQCDLDIQFDMPIFLANLDMDSDFVPAQIKGDVFLKDETIGELDLALAVNGMICAVTQTFWQERNKAKFSVIVPETVFQKGRNEVDVFVISESNGQTNLMSTKSQSKTVTYSLVTSSGLGEIIISSNGASMPVISDALKGYLDVADVKGDRVVFAGWAADVKNSQLPEAIAIFVNGEFFYSMQLNLDRPDVVKAFDNAELERAGFEYIFPLSLFKNIGDSEVRIFALSKKGVGTELIYPKGYTMGQNS